MTIPFLQLIDITGKYSSEIHETVSRVIDSGWYLQGRENTAFEANYVRYIRARHQLNIASKVYCSMNAKEHIIYVMCNFLEFLKTS